MDTKPEIFYDIIQNSPEWYAVRCGVITSSNFSKVMAKGEGKTRRKYMLGLAGERIRGMAGDAFTNDYTKRGHDFEDAALELYKERTGNDAVKVGFIRNGAFGGSPDAVVGEDGGLEIKTRSADLQAELLLDGDVPSEHKAQIMGNLFVSGRAWWDFCSYCPGMPFFHKRVVRDEMYIAGMKRELEKFDEELKQLVIQLTGMF